MTLWKERYGETREDRAEKIHKTLPPNHPAGNLPPPRPLWVWSSVPKQDGTENTTTTLSRMGLGTIDFFGHVEVRSDDSVRLRRRFVRSQRCTEPLQSFYSDNVYRVRIGNGDRAVACTCPDWTNMGPCKHMLAVEERLAEEREEENIQAVHGFDPEEQSYIDYLDSLQEEEPQPEPGAYTTRSGRAVRRPKKYGRDEFVSAAIGLQAGWAFF